MTRSYTVGVTMMHRTGGCLRSRGPSRGCGGAWGLACPQPSMPSGLSALLPGLYNYYDDEKEKLQIVEMPLAHKLSSLIILMPHHVEPLERLEKLLTREQLKTWMGKMQRKAVAISLPKGVVEVTHDLQVRGGPTWGLQGLEERGAWGTHSSAQHVCPESLWVSGQDWALLGEEGWDLPLGT